MKRTIQVEPLRPPISECGPEVNDKFVFYHDESNNIRKFYLTETGLNVPDYKNFVIAGIVLKENQSIGDTAQLRKDMRLQENAAEIKFKHIARGDFESVLKSQNLSTFFSWLIAEKIHVHYSNINIFFWSILDIVDSMVGSPQLARYQPMHMLVKNEFYRIVSGNRSVFLDLLNSYHYPCVEKDKTKSFVRDIHAFLAASGTGKMIQHNQILMELIKRASSLDELVFLVKEEPDILIRNFSSFYIHQMCLFKNSLHVFDNEYEIQKILEDFDLVDGDRLVNFRFSDSKKEIGIQLSDVMTGFFASYFSFIEEHSMSELLKIKKGLNPQQTKNLALARELIDQSDAVSPAFLHRVTSIDSQFKSDAFLHDESPMPHLL